MPFDPDAAQRIVLGHLLHQHPRMLSLAELETDLAAVEDIEVAVRRLRDDSLVSQLGQRVGVTRAAVRMEQLKPI
jgi:hypothetical protein